MAGPEFASRLAAVLREMGELFRSLGRGKGVRVIVAPGDDEALSQAIEFRAGPCVELPGGQVVSLKGEEAGGADEGVPVFSVVPASGVELVRPVELSDAEAEVLDVFTRKRQKLQAKELAPILGRSNDSRFRLLLARMRKARRLLDNEPSRGYYPTILGLESLRAWRQLQHDLFGDTA
jgi:hypothetical protein